MQVRLSSVRVLTRVYQIPVPAAPGLDSETWDPSNSPQPSLRQRTTPVAPSTPPQKPVILSAAQRSRKICGCFLSSSASQSTARNPALCQGTTSAVPKNAASTYAGFSPCVPTLGNFRLAGHTTGAHQDQIGDLTISVQRTTWKVRFQRVSGKKRTRTWPNHASLLPIPVCSSCPSVALNDQ